MYNAIRKSRKKRLFRRIITALILIIFSFSIGIAGFYFIADYSIINALYMSVITASTVGFQEVQPLTDAGRIFTVFYIITNIGIFGYTITIITNSFFEGDVKQYLLDRKINKKLKKMEDHVIVCGYGTKGRQICKELTAMDKKVIIIERDEKILDELDHQSAIAFVPGEATNDEVLLNAGVQKASALISTLPSDADNVYIMLTASHLNPDIRLITRAKNEISVTNLKRAGANYIILPEKITSHQMAHLVVKPTVTQFVDELIGIEGINATFEEFHFNDFKNDYKNKTLKDLHSEEISGINIISIKKKDQNYIINPSMDVIFDEGSILIILATYEQLKKFKSVFISSY